MWPQNGQYTACRRPRLRPAHAPYTGKAPAQLEDLRPHSLDRGVRALGIQHFGDESATCSTSRSLKPRVVEAGVPMRRPLVIIGGRGSFGTAFLFTVMLALAQGRIRILAGDVAADQAQQEQMVVGAAGDDLIAARGESRGHGARVRQHLALVVAEFRLQRLEQRHRLGRDDVHQRAALGARETPAS